MAPRTGSEVRQSFIDYFAKKQNHVYWPSSKVVPHDDPTLLFTNAGMNQFKPLFLGVADKNTHLGQLKRAVNSQKCIRAGGKHNDLDDVGKDVYHHTFFEMLGNWSFGDYFKAEAIEWAWDLLEWGISNDRLYFTYFGGNEKFNLAADLETRDLWLNLLRSAGVKDFEKRVLPFGMKENFWEMGETGPCGPCTEIHYDRIGGRDASSMVNMDDPDVLEIWNNVFMAYQRHKDGSLTELPAKHVDTGMGLERVVSVLQGKFSNYDTDLFMPLFDAIKSMAPADLPVYSGKVGVADVGKVDMAYRVVADHIRTMAFAMADGARPSNEKRGYVLKRILRRAIRYGTQTLKLPHGFLSKLLRVVTDMMSPAFPELEESYDDILKKEEEAFALTLDKGTKLLSDALDKLQNEGSKILDGRTAFRLYDTYGFPPDLTLLMCEERGFTVDTAGYAKERDEAVERSRCAQNDAGGDRLVLEVDQTVCLEKDMKIPITSEEPKYSWENATAKVLAIFGGKQRGFIQTATPADGTIGFICDRTNFYAECGGQTYDAGRAVVVSDAADEVVIYNCQVAASYVLHVSKIQSGSLRVGDTVDLKPDFERRSLIAANHTSTHMVNYALRKVLGAKVDQKGSLVDPERLRFDFAHGKKVSVDEIVAAEAIVRKLIDAGLPVNTRVMPLDEAAKVPGVKHVFGEAYPSMVRVVAVGADIIKDPFNDKWSDSPIEFCGGTHLKNTAEAESFAIIMEESVQEGVRRVVALTRDAAAQAIARGNARVAELTKLNVQCESFANEVDTKMDAMGQITTPANPRAEDAGLGLLLNRYRELDMAISAQNEIVQKEVVPVESRDKSIKISTAICKVLNRAKKRLSDVEKKTFKALGASLAAEVGDGKAVLIKSDVYTDTNVVVGEMTSAYVTACPNGVIFVVVKEASNTISAQSRRGAKVTNVDASAWLKSAIKDGTEGKGNGGGKPDYANGSCKQSEYYEKVYQVAKSFITSAGYTVIEK